MEEKIKEEVANKIMTDIRNGDMEEQSHCPKCGEPVLGEEDGLCGECV